MQIDWRDVNGMVYVSCDGDNYTVLGPAFYECELLAVDERRLVFSPVLRVEL